MSAAVAPSSAIEIAAEPYAFAVPSWERTALVVIDMQRDFMEEGGFGAALGNDVSRLQVIVPTLQRLFAAWRARGLTMIHTQEGHRPDLSDCPPAKRLRGKPGLRIGDAGPMGRILVLGEPGNDFVAELKPQPGEIVLPKPGKGAFCETGFDSILKERGITHLLITGVTTEVCVQTTMREANDRGYECLLVEDATESYFPEFKAATLAMVRAQGGIVGWTAPAGAVISALEAR
ncbi:MAG TPA: isochorismatase family cysteine hydrolase [Polyangiaceae bacterium]